MEDYVCGIDIGTKNFGITFFSSYEIIGYRGSPFLMKRYQQNNPVIEYEIKNEEDGKEIDIFDALTKMLDMMFEFKRTVLIRIEKQMSMHCSDVIRLDGIVYGYLKGLRKNVEYMSPGKRMGFMKQMYNKFPDCEHIAIPSKNFRAQKIPGLKIVKYFYGEYFSFLEINLGDKKLDDLCDSLIYAIIDTHHVEGGENGLCNIKKPKKRKLPNS